MRLINIVMNIFTKSLDNIHSYTDSFYLIRRC